MPPIPIPAPAPARTLLDGVRVGRMARHLRGPWSAEQPHGPAQGPAACSYFSGERREKGELSLENEREGGRRV